MTKYGGNDRILRGNDIKLRHPRVNGDLAGVARFRGQVDAYNTQAKRGYDICFSDGIVGMQPDQDSQVDDLLCEADVLMYEKKMEDTQSTRLAKEA